LIDYRLKLRDVPFRWQTEITEWEPPFRFVDVQKRGPFRKWVHEHRFDDWDQGTLVKDVVTYAVLGGQIVDKLFVRRDVKRIFAHRESQLRRQFGVAHPSMQPESREQNDDARGESSSSARV
jgi:ligand-binding SRPBCC domain-containing protein